MIRHRAVSAFLPEVPSAGRRHSAVVKDTVCRRAFSNRIYKGEPAGRRTCGKLCPSTSSPPSYLP